MRNTTASETTDTGEADALPEGETESDVIGFARLVMAGGPGRTNSVKAFLDLVRKNRASSEDVQDVYITDRYIFADVGERNGNPLPSGAGYGFKVDADDRDRYFDRSWTFVELHLEGQAEPAHVNVAKKSFWDRFCRELVSKEIGAWLRRTGLAPWPKGRPSKLRVVHLGGNSFAV